MSASGLRLTPCATVTSEGERCVLQWQVAPGRSGQEQRPPVPLERRCALRLLPPDQGLGICPGHGAPVAAEAALGGSRHAGAAPGCRVFIGRRLAAELLLDARHHARHATGAQAQHR